MKILIFAMDTCDADRDAESIIRTFLAAGHRCVRANYWTTDYLPKRPLLSRDIPLLTLVEGGLQNAPRLTAADYREAGGPITDFADLALHDAGVHGWPLSEERLSLESVYYQRLRGTAVMARALVRGVDPDVVVVPQGAEPVSRAIAIETSALNIPVLISESSFFPGYVNLDVGGQHFFRGLSRIDRQLPQRMRTPLTPEEAEGISNFIGDWSRRTVSKYQQQSAPSEIEKLRAFTESSRGDVVFLPGQVPCDANILPGLRSFSTLADLYAAAIGELGGDWRIVVKAHPKDSSDSIKVLKSLSNVLVLENINIHDAISCCDVVLVHSSNVGLEALMLGKPVVVLGRPLYSGLGLTSDVDSMAEIPADMRSAVGKPPDRELVHRLLHFLIKDHLIPIGDSDRIAARIAEAVEADSATRSSLKTLSNQYSVRAREYLETIRAYNVFAQLNYSDAEIREQLPQAAFPQDAKHRSALDSGERQIAYEYANIEADHLTRYCCVDAMLRPNLKILDIACGVGYGSHLLAERAFSVTGVDASSEAIEFAKSSWQHERASFYAVSAGRWFSQDREEYDAIVSFETVEHMYDAELFLRTAWSRLRPGGVLFLSSPNAEFYPLTDNPFHVRHFLGDDLATLIGNLADVEGFRAWPQNRGTIGPNVRSGRFLVSAATKGRGESALRGDLDALVPFRMTQAPVRRSFRIGAESFCTNIAMKGPKEISSNFAPSDGCIVFGPYHKLLAGQYAVRFDLAVSDHSKMGFGDLTLEVVNTQDELMAKSKLSPEQLLSPQQDSYCLLFHNRKQDLPIEFRVHARGKPVSGTLHFKGVDIQRLD